MKLANLILIASLIFFIGCSKGNGIIKMKSSKESEAQKKMEKSEPEKYFKKAEDLAKARWGSEHAYIKSVKPQESEEIAKLVRDYKVFGVEVFNPESQIAGRPFFHYSLVIDTNNDSVNYLENDKEVVKFISDLSYKTKNEKDIRKTISLFGLLRGYEICEEWVKDLSYYWEFSNYLKDPTERNYTDDAWIKEDWDYLIKKAKNKWRVSVTYLVDPYIYAYLRYTFMITESGKITIEALKGAAKLGYD